MNEQIASEVQWLRKWEQEERKEQRHGRCLRMSVCCWTDAQKVEFESFFASAEWTCDVISRLRASDATPVQEPDAATLALLRSMDYSMDCDEDVPSPVWLGWMCGHREFCKGPLLRISSPHDAEVHIFRFTFACQCMVCLTSAEACDDVLEMLAPGDLFGDAGLQVWKHRFRCT